MEKKSLVTIVAGIVGLVLLIILIFGRGGSTQFVGLANMRLAKGAVRQISQDIGTTAVGSFQLTNETKEFSLEDPEIYVVTDLENLFPGAILEYRWINKASGTVIFRDERAPIREKRKAAQDSSKLSRNSQSWGVGEYKVELSQIKKGSDNAVSERQLLGTATFVVKTAEQLQKERLQKLFPEIVLGTLVDGNDAVKSSQVTFAQDDKVIYAGVRYADLEQETTFSAKWISVEKGNTLKTFTKKVRGDGRFSLMLDATRDLERTTTRFPKGDYLLEISVDGEKFDSIKFSVK